MIAYFDTSALIPLLVEEPSSAECARLWDTADRLVSVRLLYAEARAALALAHRMQRLKGSQLRLTVRGLDALYEQLDRVEVDEALVRRAGLLAEEQELRGYDAVHLAAAERCSDDDFVLVAGDASLCRAARAIALNVSEVGRGGQPARH